MVYRRQDLEQHEHDADQPQGPHQLAAPLHRSDEATHGDSDERRQHSAQKEERPPGDGERAVGLEQHASKLPLITPAQALHHQPGTHCITTLARLRASQE
jgi:hypothetical protein